MLAATLLGGGDLLLLDEPTNHLDLAACEWLEDYLAESPAAAVLVSHDRQFLDRVTSQTWHLHAGRLTTFGGAYTAFARWHEEQQKQALAAWGRQRERIRKTEDFIRRNIAGQKSRQAQSRRKALAKEERLTPPPAAARPYALRLAPQRESGAVVLEVEGLAKAYDGRPAVEGLSLLVARGERIGVVGPNGSGKSTLLKLLAGIVFPDRGTVRLGFGVDLGYYDQHQRTVRDDRTVLAEAAAMDPVATEGELRSFLGAFGFGADLVDRPVGALSGGERGRLSLLKLIKEGHNTLLLDEPTNHLDIRCREALERALAEFAGTLIVVSHDRRFLDRLVTRLLIFPADGEPAGPPRAGGAPAGRTLSGEAPASRPRLFLGNYAQWHERQLALAGPRAGPPAAVRLAGTGGRGFGSGSGAGAPGAAPGAASGAQPAALRGAAGAAVRGADRADRAGSDAGGGPAGAAALSKNEVARRQAWMAEAEARIAALEGERDGIVTALADPRLEPERLRERADRLARLEAELAEQLALWEKWGHEIEGATGGG
jgi:ATP-binding cassette subfamily F protein 3